MAATAPAIISRAQWGANPLITPASTISTPSPELWLHHSAGEQFDAAGLRLLQSFALHRTDTHYVDLEYTLLVDRVDCTIYESRGVGHDTAATGGWTFTPWPRRHNSISHAICVMGNFQTDPVSDQLVHTLANLAAWGYEHGWWSVCGFTGGHRDASGNSTACPGNNLEAALPRINALAIAIHNGTGPTPPAPKPAPIQTGGILVNMPNAKIARIDLTSYGLNLFGGIYDAGAPVAGCGATVHGPAPHQVAGGSSDDWWPWLISATVTAQPRGNHVVVTAFLPNWKPGDPPPSVHIQAFLA